MEIYYDVSHFITTFLFSGSFKLEYLLLESSLSNQQIDGASNCTLVHDDSLENCLGPINSSQAGGLG